MHFHHLVYLADPIIFHYQHLRYYNCVVQVKVMMMVVVSIYWKKKKQSVESA